MLIYAFDPDADEKHERARHLVDSASRMRSFFCYKSSMKHSRFWFNVAALHRCHVGRSLQTLNPFNVENRTILTALVLPPRYE